MKIVKPSIEVIFFSSEDGKTPEQAIEAAGRTCYQSADRVTEESAGKFVKMLRDRGHHAMLEFGYATAKIVGDRGLMAELTRHRLCSFAIESTRFNKYSKDKYGNQIVVIEQPGLTGAPRRSVWEAAMKRAEEAYLELIALGVPAEIARSVLPIGLKAEITIGANLREWRHIFSIRCATTAHPIIRGVMLEALRQFHNKMPALYEDLAEQFLKEEQK